MPSGAIGDTVGVDWTGPIGVGPTKAGNNYAQTIVDWFPQVCEYYACKTNSAVETVLRPNGLCLKSGN